MRIVTFAACFAVAGLAACTQLGVGGQSHGLPTSQLDTQIGAAIGDPSTCVLLADAATGKELYRYGDHINCDRQMPACDVLASMNAHDALKFASVTGGRMASCNSLPDGSRTVGWAEGRVESAAHRNLIYSAVMEGQRALPGHEINARLYDAFQKAGL